MTNDASRPHDQPLKAIILMGGGVLMFSVADALIKAMSGTYPIGQIMTFRNIFACIPMAFYFYRTSGFAFFKTKRLGLQLLRGVIGVISMASIFLAFKLMPLAEAVALTMSSTIFLAALSGLLLGEAVGWKRWVAIWVGFIGVLLITRPGKNLFDGVALFALASAFLFALSMICVRHLSKTDSGATTIFYFILVCLIGSFLTIPWQWISPDHIWVKQGIIGWSPPALRDVGILALIGCVGGAAQIAMTQAFRIAPASVVAPFQYADILYSIIWGYLFWAEVPDLYLYAGGTLITLSGIFIVRHEVKRRQTNSQNSVAKPNN